MFIEENKRVGSCYFEFQFYKSDSPIKNNQIDLDIIEHWKSDSLLISDDDFDAFYKSYADIFNCALLANGEIGLDWYGPNYYDYATAEKILQELNEVIDCKYDNLIIWLKKAVKEYNGFYILGI